MQLFPRTQEAAYCVPGSEDNTLIEKRTEIWNLLVVFWGVGSCLWLRGEQCGAVMSPDGAVRCEDEINAET